MVNEPDIVFELLKASLSGDVPKVSAMDAHDWWHIFRLMQANHVAALTAGAMATQEVPREVKIPWLAERDKAERWYRYQAEVQQEIVDTMTRHGIETLVLKGTHTAQYYPQPDLREFGDLDLYFHDRHDEADAVAERELHVTVSNVSHHHSKYDYRGVTVESHYDFFNCHYPGSNRRYNQMLIALVPSSTFDVLHFLRHAAIHFADRGLRLRDLSDWVQIISNSKGIDWNTVGAEVERFGMSSFVAALDSLTHSRLGIASPLKLSCPDGIANRMEIDIFQRHPQGELIQQYLSSRWKRHLAFGDSLTSQLIHKTLSRLSH